MEFIDNNRIYRYYITREEIMTEQIITYFQNIHIVLEWMEQTNKKKNQRKCVKKHTVSDILRMYQV